MSALLIYPSPARCRALALLTVVVASAVLAGCGQPKTGNVSGMITLNGKAPDLDGLQINFLPEEGGQTVSAVINKDGSFAATGVPVGKLRAGLTYSSPGIPVVAKKLGDERLKKREARDKMEKGDKVDPKAMLPNEGKQATSAKNPIPPKFLDPLTSGKTLTVEAGVANNLTWDIRP